MHTEAAIKLEQHTLVSLGFGLTFYCISKSLTGALVCFLAGILIDVDHYIDYVRDRGFNLNIKRFFQYSHNIEYERLFIVFHGYEYVLPLACLLVITDYNSVIMALIIGFIQHLLFDQFTNPVRPLAYFITYRLRNNFSKECVLTDECLRSLVTD